MPSTYQQVCIRIMSRFYEQTKSTRFIDHIINTINRVDLVCLENLAGPKKTAYFIFWRTLKLSKTLRLWIISIKILRTKRRYAKALYSQTYVWEKLFACSECSPWDHNPGINDYFWLNWLQLSAPTQIKNISKNIVKKAFT